MASMTTKKEAVIHRLRATGSVTVTVCGIWVGGGTGRSAVITVGNWKTVTCKRCLKSVPDIGNR